MAVNPSFRYRETGVALSTAEGIITSAHEGTGEQVGSRGLTDAEEAVKKESSKHQVLVVQDGLENGDRPWLSNDGVPFRRTLGDKVHNVQYYDRLTTSIQTFEDAISSRSFLVHLLRIRGHHDAAQPYRPVFQSRPSQPRSPNPSCVSHRKALAAPKMRGHKNGQKGAAHAAESEPRERPSVPHLHVLNHELGQDSIL